MIPTVKTYATNQEVQTPIGKGVIQARVRPDGVPVENVHWLVRILINKELYRHSKGKVICLKFMIRFFCKSSMTRAMSTRK